jgi:hypothetical protein
MYVEMEAVMFHTIDDPKDRQDLFDRLSRLDPGQAPLWGRLSAPRMLVHLCDQMRMPFNDNPSGPLPGPPRLPLLREAALYFLPWPRGTIQGPPEAFVSQPGTWSTDLEKLKQLVDEFVNADPRRSWALHPNWGRLSRQQWGVFCYRHFDHHLKQFGV